MAVAFRNSSSKSEPSAGAPSRSYQETEAPDRGRSAAEAPETNQPGRMPEAPDAGEGRMNLLEHEFTHGRSQS